MDVLSTVTHNSVHVQAKDKCPLLGVHVPIDTSRQACYDGKKALTNSKQPDSLAWVTAVRRDLLRALALIEKEYGLPARSCTDCPLRR